MRNNIPAGDRKSIEEWLNARPAEGATRGRLTLGSTVDDWRVEAYLGAGRSAEVYRVVNVRTGRDGALKLLIDGEKGLYDRFLVEMDALRFLRLASLPRFYGNGTTAGRPYYVMEYLQPLLLPLPEGEAPRFICAVADAVQALHEAGFIHRDLKPANILRRVDGEPVLIDLGLVKRIAKDGVPSRPSSLSLVDGRPVGVGTVDFAAPEQLLKGEATVRSDVFALGKILRACCTEPLPHDLHVVVQRATREQPAERYPSAAAFAAAIRRRNRSWLVAGAGAVVVAGLALAAVPLLRPAPVPPSAPPVAPVSPVAPVPPPADEAPVVLTRLPDESEADHFARLVPIAEKGDVAAQLLVAEAHFYGRGTETNRAEAVRWYCRAAENGDSNAQASLGLCLLRGWGCEKDVEAAVDCYRKAAEGGNLAAMSDLAFCHMHGLGVEEDQEEAFRWAMMAAERGHPPAQVFVAECYMDGRGTATNSVRAEVWLQRAARNGNKRAQRLMRER